MRRIQKLGMFLEAHFGDVEYHMPEEPDELEEGVASAEPSFLIQLDEADARINLLSMVRVHVSPAAAAPPLVCCVFPTFSSSRASLVAFYRPSFRLRHPPSPRIPSFLPRDHRAYRR
jgi:hypothetical protein